MAIDDTQRFLDPWMFMKFDVVQVITKLLYLINQGEYSAAQKKRNP